MSAALTIPSSWATGSRRPALRLRAVERVGGVSRGAFQSEFLRPRRPVILTDLAQDWPAMQRWTPQFFVEQHGARRVKVYDASFAEPGRHYMSNLHEMSLGEYVECVVHQDRDLRMFLYNLASEIPELKRDVRLPEIADGFSERFVFMFFGCRGSVTPTHYDIDLSHVFHTAIRGRKRITLFAPADSDRLHHHPFTVRSYVDVDRPDFERFPRLAGTPGYQAVLDPGETLFIPSAFWHHVVYEEGGYAVSLRCANERHRERARGLLNLALVSPFDRLANRALGARWFRLKARLAGERTNG